MSPKYRVASLFSGVLGLDLAFRPLQAQSLVPSGVFFLAFQGPTTNIYQSPPKADAMPCLRQWLKFHMLRQKEIWYGILLACEFFTF